VGNLEDKKISGFVQEDETNPKFNFFPGYAKAGIAGCLRAFNVRGRPCTGTRRTVLDRMNRTVADPAGFGEPARADCLLRERVFSFAGFSLEPDGTLFHSGILVHLPPKELEALRLLLEHAGRIVTPQQMRAALWGEVSVTADSVTKCVSSLRARLQIEDCIQTVYKRGYRFSANVVTHDIGPRGAPARLAIAPFSTHPGVPEYLGFAVAEETAAGLARSRYPVVAVLAQDSVFTLARRGMSAQQIGAALQADFVLTGTLRALPYQYRLRAEMIRVPDAVQAWAEDVLVSRKRTAGLEIELATRLNSRLNVALPTHAPASAPPENDRLPIAAVAESFAASEHEGEGARRLKAYDLFQSAHEAWRNPQKRQMQNGLEHLLRAIELDPSLIGARVDLANLCVAQAICGYMSPADAAAMARDAAKPVGDLAGRAADILPALGWIGFHYDRNLPDALKAFGLSAHLPHDQWTTRARSFFALSRHRFSEAIGLLSDALALDPFSPLIHGRLAWALHLAGEAQESLAQARRALEQFPQDAATNFYGALILAYNGEANRAAGIAQDLETRMPYLGIAAAANAYALARAGQIQNARDTLAKVEWQAKEHFALTGFNAAVYLEMDAPDEALNTLRHSQASRCPWFFQLLADPRLKALHGQWEFEQMLAALGQMEMQAEDIAEQD
jgi:DNA-binding winged helix-turn-helix (wHTH) protein/tetratricopeptide (TPR) repeat protein